MIGDGLELFAVVVGTGKRRKVKTGEGDVC